jgi:Ran GTPase-activating protein (RanGAP) involved in mRNA processing and transport
LVLGSHPRLTSLDLARCGLADPWLAGLAPALATNTVLTALDLRTNGCAAEGARSLAAGLTNNTVLRSLQLHGNRLDAAAGVSLGAMLSVNSTLQQLELGHNELASAGVSAVLEGLLVNSCLTRLGLSYNRARDESPQLLAACQTVIASNTTLRHLSLAGFSFTATGLRALATALPYNTSLTALSLRGSLADEFGPEFVGALRTHAALTELEWPELNGSVGTQSETIRDRNQNNLSQRQLTLFDALYNTLSRASFGTPASDSYWMYWSW